MGSSGLNKITNEGSSGSVNRSTVPSSKSSSISNSSSSTKDSSSASTMKAAEEKDPYMMDLAEDMDESGPATTGSLYGNKKELSLGSKDKDRLRDDNGIGSLKRSISGPDSFGSNNRDKDNDALAR